MPTEQAKEMTQRLHASRNLDLHKGEAPPQETLVDDGWPGQSPLLADLPEDELDRNPLRAGAWVVSLARGGGTQTLHRVGSCWRVPGLHFSRFEVLEESQVLSADPKFDCPFSKICSDCFPKGIEGNTSFDGPESSSAESIDSSDSSSS